MRAARLGWTVSIGLLVVCSSVVGQTAEQTPSVRLASRWDAFKANLVAAHDEARLRLVALASARDDGSLDTDGFNERLTTFARTSPVWGSYSWPVAEFTKMPTAGFDSWDQVLSESDTELRTTKIEAALDARTRALTTPDPTACFDKRSKYTPSSVCERLLATWCWALFARDGAASLRRADPDLAITQEAIGNVEELRQLEGSRIAPYGHDDVRFAFCSAAAKTRKYDFGFVRYATWSVPPFWQAYAAGDEPNSVSSEQFELACHNRERLKEIADKLSSQLPAVPRGRARMPLEGWTYSVNRRLRQCTTLVVNDCSNVYFRSGRPIVAYLDASCRRRDATEDDLSAEIQGTGALDNEAAQPGRNNLVEHLHACSWARKNGYFWAYTKPSGSRCKPDKLRTGIWGGAGDSRLRR